MQTKLSQATATNAELTTLQEESDSLRQQLAEAKMSNVMLEAEIDAVKNQRQDTSAFDAVKQELDELKKQHSANVEAMAAEREQLLEERKHAALDYEAVIKKHVADLQVAREGANETVQEVSDLKNELQQRQANLQKLEAEIVSIKKDNEVSAKELQAHLDETNAKAQKYEADYTDMYESMTAMVMEEHKKREALERSLKDAEEKIQQAEKIQSRFDELHAQLRVKDAEIAEAKVSCL